MSEYIQAILHYIELQSTPDGACIGTFALSTFRNDVYAHGDSIEDCIAAVERALESYVLWALKTGELLPEVDGVMPPSLEPAHASLLMDTHR